MRISLIIPPNNWLSHLVPELMELRHDVVVNNCDDKCDVIISMSHSQWQATEIVHKTYPEIPLITYNWDWYDYVNKSSIEWRIYIELMKASKVVFSASKITADKCENDLGIKSKDYLYAFILPWEWEGENRDWGYTMMASRPDPNKRFDWYEKATIENDIYFKSYSPQENSRPDYIRTLKNCSIMVSASKEESLGGLTILEAAYNKKPILVGDHEGAIEVWGNDATYFKVDDYEDFKKQLKWLFDSRNSKEVQQKVIRAYNKVKNNFLPEHMAIKINESLHRNIKTNR